MPAGIAVRSRHMVPATRAGQPDDNITGLLIGLFDAIMHTWRWQPALII